MTCKQYYKDRCDKASCCPASASGLKLQSRQRCRKIYGGSSRRVLQESAYAVRKVAAGITGVVEDIDVHFGSGDFMSVGCRVNLGWIEGYVHAHSSKMFTYLKPGRPSGVQRLRFLKVPRAVIATPGGIFVICSMGRAKLRAQFVRQRLDGWERSELRVSLDAMLDLCI